MNNYIINKVGKCHRYNLKWRSCDIFEIIKYISGYVTLVQLMNNLGNVSFTVTIDCLLVFCTSYKKHYRFSKQWMWYLQFPTILRSIHILSNSIKHCVVWRRGQIHGKWRKTQVRGSGRRDKRRRLAGSRCRQHTGGRRSVPGEGVGEVANRERDTAINSCWWGGGMMYEGKEGSSKMVE